MPIRANRYYNDPQIGAAFNNIAQMFKPPSGQEIYAYARANAANEELARQREGFSALTGLYGSDPRALAMMRAGGVEAFMKSYPQYDLYQRSLAPGATPASLDTSAYALNRNAGQTFAGQAQAEAAQMERTKVEQAGQTTRTMLAPVGANAARHVPPSVASLYGVQQTQLGPSVVNPGQIVEQPSPDPAQPGRRIEGTTRPQSTDQWRAGELARLRTEDPANPAVMQQIWGQVTPTAIMQNGKPTLVAPYQAIGQQPAPPNPTGQPQIKSYKAPDGTSGTARLDPASGRLVDTQTGQPIPQGSVEVRSQNSVGDTLGSTTKNKIAETRADISITRQLLDRYETILKETPGASGALGAARRTFQQLVASGDEAAKVLGLDANNAAAEFARQGAGALAAKDFNPNLDEAEFLRHVLAYRLAKANNPSGEVGVRAYESNKQALSQGLLSTNTSSLARTAAFRKMLDAIEQGNAARSQPVTPGQQAPATPGAPQQAPATPQVERWDMGPDGVPRRVQ